MIYRVKHAWKRIVMADSKRHVELINESGLFDRTWYLSEYPDVAATGLDPLDHYLRYGVSLRRNPGPKFDANQYLAANQDVAKAGVNPLLHYVLHGKQEGRTVVPCASVLGVREQWTEAVHSTVNLMHSAPADDFDALKTENQRLRKIVGEQGTQIEMNLLQLRGLQEELENWFGQYVELKERFDTCNAKIRQDTDG